MDMKLFLESSPLYKKLDCDFNTDNTLRDLNLPVLNFRCSTCRSVQSYALEAAQSNKRGSYVSSGHYFFLVGCSIWVSYQCVSCKSERYDFLLMVDSDGKWIQKIGQWPDYKIDISPALQRTLSRLGRGALPLYRKGMANEAEGYGIGANAYYRRIVERVIQKLLDDMTKMVDESHSQDFIQAVEDAKNQQHASDKIALVKDMLPSTLRPGGLNPLGTLYQELSENIHAMTDAQCLEHAREIRTVLEFLVQHIEQNKEQRQDYIESMAKLQKKKEPAKS